MTDEPMLSQGKTGREPMLGGDEYRGIRLTITLKGYDYTKRALEEVAAKLTAEAQAAVNDALARTRADRHHRAP